MMVVSVTCNNILFLSILGQPKEFDPKFNGPIERRSCTDVICLFMLVAFILGWCLIAVVGKSLF